MQRPFRRLAVVNRGEAAMRVVHAVRELNETGADPIRLIAVHTAADRQAMAVRLADESVEIGPAQPGYHDLDAVEAALIACAADAAWVGWGAVAALPAFAELCEQRGIVFVGPGAETMRLLDDKISAKLLAEEVGAPSAPWSRGAVDTVEEAMRRAAEIGFPLMVKAAAATGGRGLRRVTAPDQLPAAFEAARAEALEASGDARVFLEAALEDARTIEVQVLADGLGTTWTLGARDCSCRRQGRKLLEESASPGLASAREHELRTAAVALFERAGYRGAGTVKFLCAPGDGPCALLGVDPRLQAAHPVTEMTTGLDLVKLQLAIAAGDRLEGEPPPASGHAIQTRIAALDPAAGFALAPGRLDLLRLPTGPFLRIDTGLGEGDTVSAGGDGLIATLAAWGRDRAEALARLRRAVAETMIVVDGGATDQGFLLELLRRPEVRAGAVDVTWLDRLHVDGGLAPAGDADVALLQAAIEIADAETALDRRRFYAFARRGRPSAGAPVARTVELRHRGERYRFAVSQLGPSRYRLAVDGSVVDVDVERRGVYERRLTIGGERRRTLTSMQGTDIVVEVDGVPHRIARDDGGIVRNTAPAVVVAIPVAVGEEVAEGDVVAVVESMKMESSFVAPFHGRIRAIHTTPNMQVGPGAPLVQLDTLDGDPPGQGGERVRFAPTQPDPYPLVHQRDELRELEWLALGFDVPPREAQRIVEELATASEPGSGERRFIELYTDLQALTRPRHDDEDGEDLLRSPQEHFHAWLRSLDAAAEGLPPGFVALLERALAHYGVDGLDRTPALEDAAYRLFLAEQRADGARAAIVALLDGCLARFAAAGSAPSESFRDALDRLVRVASRRDPVLADIARECRWRFFDEPLVDAVRATIYAEAEAGLDRLAADPEGSGREAVVEALVRCTRPLVTTITERLHDASPALRRVLLEVMTRRFYRMPSLTAFGTAGGFLTAGYRFEGADRRLVTNFTELDGLSEDVAALAAYAADLPEGAEVSADFYAERRGPAPSQDETAEALRTAIADGAAAREPPPRRRDDRGAASRPRPGRRRDLHVPPRVRHRSPRTCCCATCTR